VANPILQPGDPGFDWSQYGQYKTDTPDPVIGAKAFLAKRDPTTDPRGGQTNATAASEYLDKTNQPTGAAPQVGEQRHGAIESVEWNGTRWSPVARDASAEGGYHPGRDTSPGMAALQGMISGSAEAATPGKIGAIAGLATALPTAGISMIPAALGAGGLTGLAEMLQSHYGTANAPQSMGAGIMGAGEAAAAPVIQAGLGKLPGLLSRLPAKATGIGGAAIGGYEGYRRGGVPGAVEGAVVGGAAGAAMPRGLKALGSMFGVAPEAAAEGAATAGGATRTVGETASGFAGQSKAPFINRPTAPWAPTAGKSTEDYWPQGSTIEPPAPLTPRDPGFQPTVQGTPTSTAAPSPAVPESSYSGDPRTPPFNRDLMELLSGKRTGGLENIPPTSAPMANVASDMQDAIGSYGRASGAGSSTMRMPTQATGPFPTSIDYSTPTGPPSAGNIEPAALRGLTPDITFETPTGPPSATGESLPPPTGVPPRSLASYIPAMRDAVVQRGPASGLTPNPGRVQSMQDAIQARGDWTTGNGAPTAQTAPQATPAAPPSLRALNRGDEFWGPSAVSRSGAPAQADESMRTIMDPKTPTSYIREQLSKATVPADREFLARALRQRYSMAKSGR
jgi:hypothetical protein